MVLEIECILSNFASKTQITSTVLRVLKRAKRVLIPPLSEVERLLSVAYRNQAQVTNLACPVAAFTGLSDGLDTRQHYWLRADPAFLEADLSVLYLHAAPERSLNLNRLDSVAERIQSLLDLYQIHLHRPHPARWYFSMAFDPGLHTISPTELMGRALDRDGLELSEGSSVPWRRLMTEIQMVLHAAQTPFNTLWLWGGGYLPNKTVFQKKPWDGLLSDDLLAISLANYLDIPITSMHMLLPLPQSGKYLLYLPGSPESIQRSALETCVDLVKQRKLQLLRLYQAEGTLYQLTPYFIRRFWRDWS